MSVECPTKAKSPLYSHLKLDQVKCYALDVFLQFPPFMTTLKSLNVKAGAKKQTSHQKTHGETD
ncbi:hypothetical protein AT5G22785 [Arabidopsis thaliana]|uniref:Uncharacterized protein n=1 Tax=Arabidopsis thaliana TaxID=3702 RepID=A0A1P8B9U7_ARATH|nr:uncharacterized protein AT5G22785 [Arabidopsis thaliana]ANM68366.1 hypothetical protein AT5G22785 [Arabidopsis thaliana]|eukprot:NP_001330128.1 hypothetical protein AT5G22785 [Arabidopsis thaliana]